MVIAARNEDALNRAVTELNTSGEACRGVRADMSKPEDIARVVAACNEWGGIEILVNNVGGGAGRQVRRPHR